MRPFALRSQLFLLAWLMSGITSTPGQAATPGHLGGPRAEFATPKHDFGKVKSSDVVRHDFVITNRGNETLIVTDVQPTCGCTVAETWDREIPPGKTGKIPVEFNPANFDGKVTKTITVLTNETGAPTHTLEFQALVWRPVDVQPSYLYFTPIAGSSANETKIVRITSNLDQPLTLEPPVSSNPALALTLKTVKPGKQFELHVQARSETGGNQPQAPITIKTSSHEYPVISITATVLPQPAVTVGPPQIILPAGKSSSGHQRSLTIRNNLSEPMRLTDATVNAQGVTAAIKESQPGKIFTVNIAFPADFEVTPQTPLALTLRTSHPQVSTLTIPIRQSAGVTTAVPPAKAERSATPQR